MKTEGENAFPVGFRRPPRSTRFPKGRSGNPKGRPRRRAAEGADFFTLLRSALNEGVPVKENDEHKTITKAEAIAKQIVNKGASGDARAIQVLFALLRSIETRFDSAEAERAEAVGAQMLMLGRLTLEERHELRRLVAKAQGQAENDASPEEVQASPKPKKGKEVRHEQ